jgi:hypothetical protein
MTKFYACVFGVLLAAVAATGVRGQNAGAKKPSGPIGDIVSVDVAKGLLTIKTTAGPAHATVTSSTEYLVVEPGKTTLEGATPATIADVKIGDRVWARGEPSADGVIAARQVVVMSAEAIAERNRRDAQDWQRRGLRGEVRAVDAAKGELTVDTYRGDTVVVAVGTGTSLRRLKGSVDDLANSEPIALADFQVGNQIAARGDRTPDGTRLTAETLVTGAFAHPVGGRVTAVNASKGEVRITTRAGKDVAFTLVDGALVRKLTPPAARPGGWGGPGGAGGARPQQPGAGAAPQQGAQTGPAAPGSGAPEGQAAAGGGAPGGPPGPGGGGFRGPGGPGGGPGGPGGPGGWGRGRGFGFALDDPAELERRTTGITLADVKTGDIVFAVVEPGASDAAATVKVLVKLDLPPDRTPRGPGMQGQPQQGDPGMDEPQF